MPKIEVMDHLLFQHTCVYKGILIIKVRRSVNLGSLQNGSLQMAHKVEDRYSDQFLH